jgi:hypothetical protein
MMIRKALLITVILLAALSTRVHAFLLEGPAQFYRASYQASYPGNATPYIVSDPIDILPPGFITIVAAGETYYYAKGIFYQKSLREQKYVIVPPPIGAVVFNIPQGYQMIIHNGVAYYAYGGVYYKRVLEGYQVIGAAL